MIPIALHPDIENYFEISPAAVSLQSRYERGDVSIFPSVSLPSNCDLAFIQNLVPSVDLSEHALKKAKVRLLLLPLDQHPEDHLLLRMGLTREQASYYQEQIKNVTAFIDRFVFENFPGYCAVSISHTWRFGLQTTEELHYDSYGSDADEHSNLRIFINVDTVPRVWATTHKVWNAIDRFVRSESLPDKIPHPNQFNNYVNSFVSNSTERHYIIFPSMSMWIGNSQTIGHQIVYGRKLLAYTYKIHKDTLKNREWDFVEAVRRKMRTLGREMQ